MLETEVISPESRVLGSYTQIGIDLVICMLHLSKEAKLATMTLGVHLFILQASGFRHSISHDFSLGDRALCYFYLL